MLKGPHWQATRKTYHIKRNKRVEFDETMKITKENRNGQPPKITRVATEQSDKLDNLGESKHEEEL